MKKYAKHLTVLMALLFLLLSAGRAQDEFYLNIGMDRPVQYPGAPFKVNISASLKTKGKGALKKAVILWVYRISPEETTKDFRQVLQGKKPVKKLKKVLKFPRQEYEWYSAQDTLQFTGLPPGNYLMRLTCEQKEAFQLCTVTSMGVTVKTDREKLLVFVQDQKTGKPLPDIKINVIDPSTKTAHTGYTRADGTVETLFSSLQGYKPGQNLQVIAVKGEEQIGTFAYANVQGSEFKGYIYTDRPIYRPGQKVYVKGILRNYKDGAYTLKRDEKVNVKITDPRGKEAKKVDIKTDQFGNIDLDYQVGEKPPLGSYFIYISCSNGNASGNFKVEEYRKPEFEIQVKPEKEFYVQKEKVQAEITAKYYFGAPVPDTDFTYEVRRSYFYPYYERFQWWEEDVEMPGRYYESGENITTGSGKTDKQGKAKVSFDSKKWEHDAVYSIKISMTDKSRREVTGSANVKVTKGQFYLNINADKYFYETGDTVKLTVKSLDYYEKPVTTPYKLKIIRTVYKDNKSVDKEVLKKDLKTDEAGIDHFDFVPDSPGYYHVQVAAKDQLGNNITVDHYFYASERDAWSSWYNFSSMDFIMDKTYYDPGDNAKILLTIPHRGTSVLVTVEGEKIFHSEVMDFKGNTRVLVLPVSREYAPNVFISMSYFKDKDFHNSFKRLVVPDRENFLTLKITHDKEVYKPRGTAAFTIDTLDWQNRPVSAQVTMGVADESIYAVSPENTPNIQKFFYGLKPNSVYTASSFYNTLRDKGVVEDEGYVSSARSEEAKSNAESDSDYNKKKISSSGAKSGFVSPEFIREYFPDTCYFNPNIITDQNGRARVNVALPDSLTTWRATARGITADSKVGEAADKVVVSKDLLVRLIAPRFLTERDEAVVTGIVHNYLKTEKKIVMKLAMKGLLLEGASKVEVNVKPGDSRKVDWKVKADRIGDAVITLTGLTNVESDAMKLTIPILPHGTEKYAASSGVTEQNETTELVLPDQGSRNSARLRIQVSPSIASAMFGALQYLAGYPYGCVEQTMSRFLPTVVVAKTLRDFDIYDPKLNAELPKMVQKGLDRLYDFHHADGGWGWWKDDDSHPYMTAYVVYGLVKAKEAGYQIRMDKVHAAVNWLRKSYGGQKELNTRTYMLFALAEAGEVQKKWAVDLYGERNSLDNYSCALLAMVLHKYGLKDQALDIIKILENTGEEAGTLCTWKGRAHEHGWTDNQVETTAYVLQAFLMVKPDSPLIQKTVRYLSFSRNGERWYSTKDTAAAVMALAGYLKQSRELDADYSGTITVNGKVLRQFTFTGKDTGGPGIELVIPGTRLQTGKNTITFEKKGKGKLYYSAYLAYYSTEEKIKAQSAGFNVKREYFLINPKANDNDKNYLIPLQGQEFKLVSQDRIQVKLTVTGSSDYEYVIIEDPKPAGCEITGNLQGAGENWGHWYTASEVRDDRMAFFVTRFYKGTKTITYTLRAETPGTFHTMPARASLMYIPEVGGISDENIITIEEKTGPDVRAYQLPPGYHPVGGFWDRMASFFSVGK